MPNQPMAEVFGHKIDDFSTEAQRHRRHRLCPFSNKVPNCTKDKVNDPLGVCSIYDGNDITITCPVRFRQDWLIATDAAEFFGSSGIHGVDTQIFREGRFGQQDRPVKPSRKMVVKPMSSG